MLLGTGLERLWHRTRAHCLFSTAHWSVDDVGLALAGLVAGRLLPDGAPLVVAVDDTLFKRSGRKVHGAAWQHDGAATGPRPAGFGNCRVVAGIVVALPFLVSRTFLYDNPDARAAATAARAEAGERQTQLLADQDQEREATWRERALNAEDALKAAHAEILTQRTRIGELLGQIRDLEAEWTQEAVQRITTENTTLKQRVRQLTTDNRTLDERLKAARSNLRFQDRRVADLEAQITEPGPRL